jgi:alkylation response protein AidB-like acyl-CoA dehydrogenase
MMGAFTDEQMEFAELAAKLFAAPAGDAVVLEEARVGAAKAEFAEVGLPLMAVPEHLGGLGCNELDVVLILEHAGYADVPVPIAETIGVVAPMLARYGTPGQRERWLPALADGRSLGTTACLATGLGSRCGADLALAEHDGRVHVVDLDAIDRTRLVRSPDDTLAALDSSCLAEPSTSVAELRSRAAWVTAAVLNGVSRRLLELSVEHARTRQQFGVAIGSFQAVKHMCAEMAAGIESARPTAWSAARALASADPGSACAARVAKAIAGDAGALANHHALQIHGAIGFTKEHPLHRWLLFGHELESRWGTPVEHHAALGAGAVAGDSIVETFLP